MNLLAFSEAIRTVLLKRGPSTKEGPGPYLLTLERVRDKSAEKGRTLTTVEELVIRLWLSGSRDEIGGYQRVIDEPLSAEQLADPQFVLAGPARTQPFRSLVRVHLDRPGMSRQGAQMDQGFSKIPVVFHQEEKYRGKWAQFDGSIDDVVTRSTLAASTAGGNVHNLSLPDISQNVIQAAQFTKTLPAFVWADAFSGQMRKNDKFGETFRIADDRKQSGEKVYQEHCLRCHGEPLQVDGKQYWAPPKDDGNSGLKFGDIIPIEIIGTDPNRVEYRHNEAAAGPIADEFGDKFRKNHPLGNFTSKNLRAPHGYLAGPISGAFLRAPYLHNASILTLAVLIGLEKRRDYFYRGRNVYDPVRVGYWSPDVPVDSKTKEPVSTKSHDPQYYFFFDTRVRGNSNKGHQYPKWAFDLEKPMSADRTKQLQDLLEYLKTL
jgi:hypothetical protein